MIPFVLSVISHLPSSNFLKKSEKYVVNTDEPADPQQKKDESQNQKPKPRNLSRFRRYAGLLLAILSSMMFSFTGLIVKVIPHYHPLTQATWMFVGTVILAIPLNALKYAYEAYAASRMDADKKPSGQFKSLPDTIEPVFTVSSTKTSPIAPILPEPHRQQRRLRQFKLAILLLVRACSGCSGMILYFYSLKYLNVGDSLVIVCSSPIFVFIIAYLFLGERCGIIPVITILLCMAGVSVITRPPLLTGKEAFETDDMIGAALAFSSMLCIAMTIILMRFLQNVYHGLINLVFGAWGTLQTTGLALAMGVLQLPRDFRDAILMSATGVLFFLGQTFLAVALQFEEAGPVSLVRTSEVVFAFIWQFIFLHVAPDIFSISGAALILAGIVLTISRKWIASMPESSATRKMFSFLLR